MAVAITCQCNTTYELKDEFAGKLVKCPKCGTENRATTKLTPKSQADPAFDRDVFLLRQKALAINEKYAVSDEAGNPVLFIERPRHFLRNLGAMLVGVLAATAVLMALIKSSEWATAQVSVGAGGVVAFLGFLLWPVTLIVVALGLSKKRHVTFYRNEEKTEKLMEALQDKKFEILTTTFTIRDAQGRVLGRMRKNYLSNIFRKKWRLMSISGNLILLAKEDSIILSLLRRVLGPLFGLLRTNFVFTDAADKHVGEFQRKMTILDRYALDMRPDRNRNVDRRLALALGVILDTGERR